MCDLMSTSCITTTNGKSFNDVVFVCLLWMFGCFDICGFIGRLFALAMLVFGVVNVCEWLRLL
ncbi:hypothetical protein DsansV1_C03g0029031 [Dioscorea sansibarensis]